MNIHFKLTSVLLFFFLVSCGDDDGIPGPPGPQGPQGPEGVPGEIGYVFEYENIDFTSPDYEVYLPFGDFEVFDSDVALVYFLWGEDEVDGELLEIWRQLPQTVITENGMLQYNFDYTKRDIRLFLDANYPLDQLAAIDTDDWFVRVVIVPGEFWNTAARIDLSDYNKVKEMLGLPDLAPKKGISRRPVK